MQLAWVGDAVGRVRSSNRPRTGLVDFAGLDNCVVGGVTCPTPSRMGAVVDVVVVGAGVSGLTCAVALLEAGAEVRVVTAGAPAGTVSAVAGAMVGPVFGSGDERSLAWERLSDGRFRELAKDPTTGVRIVAGRMLSAPELGPGLPTWAGEVPGFVGELGDDRLPEGFTSGFAVNLPFADMPVYLAWLVRRLQQLGGSVEQHLVTDLDEVARRLCRELRRSRRGRSRARRHARASLGPTCHRRSPVGDGVRDGGWRGARLHQRGAAPSRRTARRCTTARSQ